MLESAAHCGIEHWDRGAPRRDESSHPLELFRVDATAEVGGPSRPEVAPRVRASGAEFERNSDVGGCGAARPPKARFVLRPQRVEEGGRGAVQGRAVGVLKRGL